MKKALAILISIALVLPVIAAGQKAYTATLPAVGLQRSPVQLKNAFNEVLTWVNDIYEDTDNGANLNKALITDGNGHIGQSNVVRGTTDVLVTGAGSAGQYVVSAGGGAWGYNTITTNTAFVYENTAQVNSANNKKVQLGPSVTKFHLHDPAGVNEEFYVRPGNGALLSGVTVNGDSLVTLNKLAPSAFTFLKPNAEYHFVSTDTNNYQVDNGSLSTNSVNTNTITDLAVNTADIAGSAVTLAKMASLATGVIGQIEGSSGTPKKLRLAEHFITRNGSLSTTSEDITLRGYRTHSVVRSANNLGSTRNRVVSTNSETSIISPSTRLTSNVIDPGNSTWPTIKANTLESGHTYRVRGIGRVSSTATDTARLKIKLGSVVVADSGASDLPINGIVEVEGTITVMSPGASGEVVGNCFIRVNSLSSGSSTVATAAVSPVVVDTTINNTFDVTWTWEVSSASNDVEFTTVTVERVY